jgi:hypothetical protein
MSPTQEKYALSELTELDHLTHGMEIFTMEQLLGHKRDIYMELRV